MQVMRTTHHGKTRCWNCWCPVQGSRCVA